MRCFRSFANAIKSDIVRLRFDQKVQVIGHEAVRSDRERVQRRGLQHLRERLRHDVSCDEHDSVVHGSKRSTNSDAGLCRRKPRADADGLDMPTAIARDVPASRRYGSRGTA